jgi:hexulose-6-phosphate isomerase
MNRREFIVKGATGLAAATVTSLVIAKEQDAAVAPKRTLKKGIMWGTVGVKGSVLEKMRAVKAAGFEGAEMDSHMNQDEVVAARTRPGCSYPACAVQNIGTNRCRILTPKSGKRALKH